jgi:hypothetical protein
MVRREACSGEQAGAEEEEEAGMAQAAAEEAARRLSTKPFAAE